ncbi:MAG: DUF1643 domain-containing protein [Burkholderiales bacterium]|nr:DUF1643 domain-containing protein [Burkholderiales bacterium]
MHSDSLQTFARRHGLLEPDVRSDADGTHVFVYSADMCRRYAYSLTWSDDEQHLLWIMLNPGTGETEGRRRNTFERCKAWTRSMGFGGMLFGNVSAYRSRSAVELLQQAQPPDPLNDEALEHLSRLAGKTVVAWGNHGARAVHVASLRQHLLAPQCFGLTKVGQPRHPLYVPATTPLIPW